jgi:hypothetical protein
MWCEQEEEERRGRGVLRTENQLLAAVSDDAVKYLGMCYILSANKAPWQHMPYIVDVARASAAD